MYSCTPDKYKEYMDGKIEPLNYIDNYSKQRYTCSTVQM